MATAEQVKCLVKAYANHDDEKFTTVALQIAAHEARVGHDAVARDLKKEIDLISKKKPETYRIEPVNPLFLFSSPSVRESDLIVSEDLATRIERVLIEFRNRRKLQSYGYANRRKLLLEGVPGTGKTLTASVIASELGLPLYTVQMDKLVSKFMGETSSKLRQVFDAMYTDEGVYFFDEFDAMVPQRSGEEGNQHYDSEVNEFLCMLNNASDKGVYVLAATNHPERIDKAVLRTGRIDEMVYIDMPDIEARKSLFALELSKLPTEGDIDTTHLSELTNGYNCSDISYIVKSAARKKFNETIKSPDGKKQGITQEVLEEIIATRSPSVSTKSLREYERVRSEFSPKDKGLKPVTIGFR